jgi:hypothetical protein
LDASPAPAGEGSDPSEPADRSGAPKAAIPPTGKIPATEGENRSPDVIEAARVPAARASGVGRRSGCENFREIIRAKYEQGLSAQRIYQDLTSEHDARLGYDSVKRFVRRLRDKTPLPFRRLEVSVASVAS